MGSWHIIWNDPRQEIVRRKKRKEGRNGEIEEREWPVECGRKGVWNGKRRLEEDVDEKGRWRRWWVRLGDG